METKKCTKCGIEKPMTEFTTDNKKKDKHFNACKECERKRRLKWDDENKDRIKKVRQLYNITHEKEIKDYNKKYYSEHNQQEIKRQRKYYKLNKNKILAKKKIYFMINREHELKRCKEWARNNPEKATQKSMKRYAIKKGATVEKVDYSKILERDGYICHICGGVVEPNDVHFDHVIPLSRGGKHSMDNIKVSHSHCNLVKSNKTLEELKSSFFISALENDF